MMMYRLSIFERSGDVHILHGSLDDIFWFIDRIPFESGLFFKISEV